MSDAVRLKALDAMRGVAAIGVVVWHWQLMMLAHGPKTTWPPLGGEPDRTTLPFYALLKPYYEYGFRGVDLFFVLSGFVFFYLYQRPISEGRVSGGRFFGLRFSRLYPLHLLMLLVVAILEGAFLRPTGQTFAYGGYDARHFLQNLLMINVPDFSFNGPTWTLTIEIVMYALFWTAGRLGLLKGWLVPVGLVMLGMALWTLKPDIAMQFGRGLGGFFSGGVAFKLFEALTALDRPARHRWIRGIILAVVLGWALLAALIAMDVNPAAASPIAPLAIRDFWIPWLVIYGLFPATVILAALWERRRKVGDGLFDWMGSICYSSYLIHFPMLLGLAVAVARGLASPEIVHDPIVFVGFFAGLLALSRLSFSWIEMPMQALLRRSLLGRPWLRVSAPRAAEP